MIEILRKIWRFAGEEQKNIRTSIIGCFFFAVFHMFQMAAIYVVILALVDGSASSAPAWQALGLSLIHISVPPAAGTPQWRTSWPGSGT